MAQTAEDKRDRLHEMLHNSGTWDLSKNDTDAIRYALSMINQLAGELALRTGSTIPTVIAEASTIVEARKS